MTTRAQLESEREALRMVLNHTEYQISAGYDSKMWSDRRTALTASIARLDALLSLSDTQIAFVTGTLDAGADALQRERAGAQALRAVANLIRREPRGDV